MRGTWLAIKQQRGVYLSLFTIALCLFTFSLLMMGWWNLKLLAANAAGQSVISVYLDAQAQPEQLQSAMEQLRSWNGNRRVVYVSPAAALEQLQELLGDKTVLDEAFGGFNPLTGYLEVEVKPETAVAVAQSARELTGVRSVRDNQLLLDRLQLVITAVNWTGLLLASLLGLLTMVVVAHTVRQGLAAQRDQMDILRLMGAAEGFVVAPFLLEGVLLGIIGGLVAAIGGIASYQLGVGVITRAFPFLPVIPGAALLVPVILSAVGLGMVFALVGAVVAIRE